MKVNENLKTMLPKRDLQQNAVYNGTKSFHELVQKQESKLFVEQLNALMKELEEVGNRLSKSRSFQDLSRFKKIVKRFIQEAVEYGMSLKKSNSWDYYGNKRTHTVIEKIDQKLIELTEDILEKEKEGIEILGKIGEIKGLLINLYT